VLPEYFSDECIRDPQVRKLIDKIEMIGDMAPEEKITTRIKLKMKDGQIFSAGRGMASGDFYVTPLSEQQIIQKFMYNAAFSGGISSARAQLIIDSILNLEKTADIRELTALLVSEKKRSD